MINFLYRGNLRIFTVLCEQYKLSLKRDPCYYDVSMAIYSIYLFSSYKSYKSQYLDRIGQVFFNVPAPKKTNNLGILGIIVFDWLKNLNITFNFFQLIYFPVYWVMMKIQNRVQ